MGHSTIANRTKRVPTEMKAHSGILVIRQASVKHDDTKMIELNYHNV